MEKAKLQEELNRLQGVILQSLEAKNIGRNKLGNVNQHESSGTNSFSWKKSKMPAEKCPINNRDLLKSTIFVNPHMLNTLKSDKDKKLIQEANVSQQVPNKILNISKLEKNCQNTIEGVNNGKMISESNTRAVNKYCRTSKQLNKELNIQNINIFINPTKLGKYPIHIEENSTPITLDTQNSLPNTVKSLRKVFINPNFHRSHSEITKQFNTEELSKSTNNGKTKLISNNCKHTNTIFQNEINNDDNKVYQISRIESLNEKKHRTMLSKGQPSLYSNNITIFINPDFNSLKKEDSSSTITAESVRNNDTTLNIDVECPANNGYGANHNNQNVIHDSFINKPQTSKAIIPPVKHLVDCNDSKIVSKTDELTSIQRKRKSLENDVTLGKKRIFVNPEFRTNVFSSNNVMKNHTTFHSSSFELTSNINATVKGRNDVTIVDKSKMQISFPKINVKGTSKVSNNMSILNHQSNSNGGKLVSLSATKLVRKRKISQSLNESNKVMIYKNPKYVSKTKLIRYTTSKKITNNQGPEKLQSKPLICGDHIVLPDIASTSKPSTTVTTKIRSKNGKTLKLIRKTVESVKKVHELSKVKSINVLQKRKFLTSKQRLCTIPTRSSKTKFSKINVTTNKDISILNKYVYNNKNYSLRKPLTKAAVLTRNKNDVIKPLQTNNLAQQANFIKSKYRLVRRLSDAQDLCRMKAVVTIRHKNNVVNKTSQVSNVAGKAKYVKSKYRLVRKLSNVQEQNRRSFMKRKYISSYTDVQSPSKRKWNIRNAQLKTIFKRKQFCVVNIGGAFYRCSRTSLIRNKPSIKAIGKQNKCRLLYIHGKKFKLENNGQTLTCLDNKVGRGRIDIGGVTFIKSSAGTSLIRTNYHTARTILRNAKQKSLSLHKRNLKKNNEPCLFFHRFGHCSGKERGTCIRQHDAKYIAVCKKFVQGQCSDPNCQLSHSMSCHNMPTCQHFLAGNCGRDHCPYLHIKVNNNAPLCLQFLQGYCPLGDQCIKRHFLICPAFEKGACPRGKYCPYPHPKSKQVITTNTKFRTIKRKLPPPRDPKPVSTPSLRYFEDVNLHKENVTEVKEEKCEVASIDSVTDNEEDGKKLIFTRSKLGTLPSFIPFS